jgi:thioredoxin-like negative regulator of GroEL
MALFDWIRNAFAEKARNKPAAARLPHWPRSTWRPGSPPVTAAELADVLARHPVVVFHFWAIWNTSDRAFDAVLTPLRRDFEDRIAFRSVDVDDPELRSFCLECEVANVPVLALFVSGRRVKTLMGVRPEAELRTEFGRLHGPASHRESPKPSRF